MGSSSSSPLVIPALEASADDDISNAIVAAVHTCLCDTAKHQSNIARANKGRADIRATVDELMHAIKDDVFVNELIDKSAEELLRMFPESFNDPKTEDAKPCTPSLANGIQCGIYMQQMIMAQTDKCDFDNPHVELVMHDATRAAFPLVGQHRVSRMEARVNMSYVDAARCTEEDLPIPASLILDGVEPKACASSLCNLITKEKSPMFDTPVGTIPIRLLYRLRQITSIMHTPLAYLEEPSWDGYVGSAEQGVAMMQAITRIGSWAAPDVHPYCEVDTRSEDCIKSVPYDNPETATVVTMFLRRSKGHAGGWVDDDGDGGEAGQDVDPTGARRRLEQNMKSCLLPWLYAVCRLIGRQSVSYLSLWQHNGTVSCDTVRPEIDSLNRVHEDALGDPGTMSFITAHITRNSGVAMLIGALVTRPPPDIKTLFEGEVNPRWLSLVTPQLVADYLRYHLAGAGQSVDRLFVFDNLCFNAWVCKKLRLPLGSLRLCKQEHDPEFFDTMKRAVLQEASAILLRVLLHVTLRNFTDEEKVTASSFIESMDGAPVPIGARLSSDDIYGTLPDTQNTLTMWGVRGPGITEVYHGFIDATSSAFNRLRLQPFFALFPVDCAFDVFGGPWDTQYIGDALGTAIHSIRAIPGDTVLVAKEDLVVRYCRLVGELARMCTLDNSPPIDFDEVEIWRVRNSPPPALVDAVRCVRNVRAHDDRKAAPNAVYARGPVSLTDALLVQAMAAVIRRQVNLIVGVMRPSGFEIDEAASFYNIEHPVSIYKRIEMGGLVVYNVIVVKS